MAVKQNLETLIQISFSRHMCTQVYKANFHEIITPLKIVRDPLRGPTF